MRKTETRKIGEHTYRVRQLGFIAGQELFLVLLQTILPYLDKVDISKLQATLQSEDSKDWSYAWALLTDFVRKADPKKVDYVTSVLAAETTLIMGVVGDEEIKKPLAGVYDDHFAGDYGGWFSWLVFSLEVNYLGFFKQGSGEKGTGLLTRVSSLLKDLKGSQPQKDQTGKPGTS